MAIGQTQQPYEFQYQVPYGFRQPATQTYVVQVAAQQPSNLLKLKK